MSDWQVGDLAVCVNAGSAGSALEDGRIYTVSGIFSQSGPSWLRSHAPYGLYLAEAVAPSSSGSFDPERFRKIRPDEHEGNAEDWQLLRETHKRKVSA